MAKKSKVNQTRRMAPAGSKPTGKAAVSKSSARRPNNGRPASMHAARNPHKSVEPEVNVLAVRIVAGVFALLCAAGVVVALLISKVAMNTGTVITMALVGIWIAFCIFAAVQPQVVVGWVKRLGKS